MHSIKFQSILPPGTTPPSFVSLVFEKRQEAFPPVDYKATIVAYWDSLDPLHAIEIQQIFYQSPGVTTKWVIADVLEDNARDRTDLKITYECAATFVPAGFELPIDMRLAGLEPIAPPPSPQH